MSTPDDGPAVETRGGENPDWDNAKPGEPLREKPPHVIRDVELVSWGPILYPLQSAGDPE